jgi:hypothetical protein
MKFSPDACVNCETRFRNTFVSDYTGDNFISDNRGSFFRSPFWFCCDRCVFETLDKLVEKRFRMGRTPYEDPDCPDHHIEEFIEDWKRRCEIAWDSAIEKLQNLTVNAWDAHHKKNQQDRAKELARHEASVQREMKLEEKEAQRAQKEAQKEEQQKRQEAERLKKELQREAEDDYNRLVDKAFIENDEHTYLTERTAVPFYFPEDRWRFAGTWCVGFSGSGKSNLLHHLILNDIKKGCAILVMDNKLDLVQPLKTYAAIQDRLVLLEPRPDFLLALNPFDIPGATRVHTIELIEHILSSQLSELTGIQSYLFKHIVPAPMTSTRNQP